MTPLSAATARLWWLRACVAVEDGADVPLSHTVSDVSSRCPPDVCVAAVLGDARRRMSVLGGREGMPRSLGSVYAASVTRFLGGGLRGVVSRVFDTPGESYGNGIAVTCDGSTLLLSDFLETNSIYVLSAADGSMCRVIGRRGTRPLQFTHPHQVCVAPDGFVFVADVDNYRVQVLTPDLTFHGFIGESEDDRPVGVCANADVVVVVQREGIPSQRPRRHVDVDAERRYIVAFRRSDGAVVARFGRVGDGDGRLHEPRGICFLHDGRHVAVADSHNDRVSVFSVDGEFIRHVGVGVLSRPTGVACSAFDELVVADTDNHCVRVFSGVGDLLMTIDRDDCDVTGVAIHGTTVFAVCGACRHCLVVS
jgi:DNA-binding beta-propeller fold protein YncE